MSRDYDDDDDDRYDDDSEHDVSEPTRKGVGAVRRAALVNPQKHRSSA